MTEVTKGPQRAVAITGQTAEWCRNWAEFLDRKADKDEADAQALRARSERGHAEARDYRAWAALACHHCDKTPERDGDHSCPCPHRDEDCPDHPIANAGSGATGAPLANEASSS